MVILVSPAKLPYLGSISLTVAPGIRDTNTNENIENDLFSIYKIIEIQWNLSGTNTVRNIEMCFL